MSKPYKNQTERYAYFMMLEGAAIFLVVGLLSCDSRVQNYLFGSRSKSDSIAQRVAVRKLEGGGITPFVAPANNGTIGTQELSLSLEGSDSLEFDAQPTFENPETPTPAESDLNAFTGSRDFMRLPDDLIDLPKLPESTLDDLEIETSELSLDGDAGQQQDLDPAPGFSPTESDLDLSPYGNESTNEFEIRGTIESDQDAPMESEQYNDFQPQLSLDDPLQPLPSAEPKVPRPSPSMDVPQEHPTWWMQYYTSSLMHNRVAVRTTLDEIIFVALRNSPQLRILNTQPAIQETLRDEEVAAFDWGTFAETRWNDIDEPVGSDLTTGAPGRFIQREWSYEAGLTKRLLSGGEVRFGQNFGTLDSNSSFLNPPDQGTSQFIVDYRQPLLRGFGRDFNTSQVVLADIEFDASSSRAIQETQAFIVEVVAAYWDVYQARVFLIQLRRNVQRADELVHQLKNRRGIDVSNDQLLRAEAAAAARRSEMIRAEYNLINTQDILNNLVLGPESTNATHVELIPDAINLPSTIQFSPEMTVEVALVNRPEIREAFANSRNAAVRQAVAANSLLPQLDAIVQTYVNGLRGAKDFTSAFVDQFSGGNPSYSVGFSYDLPIGNRAAKARVKRSEIEVRLIQDELRKTMGDVILDARVSARNVQRLNLEIANNFKALLKANQELQLIRQRQKMMLDDNRTGSLYIEDLLASQARLTVAEQRLAATQREQAVALVDLKRATGELLHSNSLEIYSQQVAVPLYHSQVPQAPQVPVLSSANPNAPKYDGNETDFVATKDKGVFARIDDWDAGVDNQKSRLDEQNADVVDQDARLDEHTESLDPEPASSTLEEAVPVKTESVIVDPEFFKSVNIEPITTEPVNVSTPAKSGFEFQQLPIPD